MRGGFGGLHRLHDDYIACTCRGQARSFQIVSTTKRLCLTDTGVGVYHRSTIHIHEGIIVNCSRHPKIETGLTCASCGTPICPKCMVVTPVGMKCPNCGKSKNSVLFTVSPGRFALSAIVALIAGALATLIGGIGFFAWFIAAPYGYFAGTTIMKAAGMKRGSKMEILTGAGIVIGALAVKLGPLALILSLKGFVPVGLVLSILAQNIYTWIAVGIAASCAVSKVRYL